MTHGAHKQQWQWFGPRRTGHCGFGCIHEGDQGNDLKFSSLNFTAKFVTHPYLDPQMAQDRPEVVVFSTSTQPYCCGVGSTERNQLPRPHRMVEVFLYTRLSPVKFTRLSFFQFFQPLCRITVILTVISVCSVADMPEAIGVLVVAKKGFNKHQRNAATCSRALKELTARVRSCLYI